MSNPIPNNLSLLPNWKKGKQKRDSTFMVSQFNLNLKAVKPRISNFPFMSPENKDFERNQKFAGYHKNGNDKKKLPLRQNSGLVDFFCLVLRWSIILVCFYFVMVGCFETCECLSISYIQEKIYFVHV